jgi:hypothetical protein
MQRTPNFYITIMSCHSRQPTAPASPHLQNAQPVNLAQFAPVLPLDSLALPTCLVLNTASQAPARVRETLQGEFCSQAER